MAKKLCKLTECEWAIMNTIWDNEPCAVSVAQEILENEKKWAYSTVKTMMDRMVVKGLLTATKVQRLYFYH